MRFSVIEPCGMWGGCYYPTSPPTILLSSIGKRALKRPLKNKPRCRAVIFPKSTTGFELFEKLPTYMTKPILWVEANIMGKPTHGHTGKIAKPIPLCQAKKPLATPYVIGLLWERETIKGRDRVLILFIFNIYSYLSNSSSTL